MARSVQRASMLLILLAAAGQARAQDNAVRTIYASMENRIRSEYQSSLAEMSRETAREPSGKIDKTKALLALIYYNKAALFASCAADAEKDRPPRATRVPAAQNLVLRTCVEVKFAALDKFTQVSAYAGLFFPERIAPCEERARLAAQEKVLPPYRFLQPDAPKLYDFARYNQCLMTKP